jgi:hypothetical protein
MQKSLFPAPPHRPFVLFLVIAEFEAKDTVPFIEPDREVQVLGEKYPSVRITGYLPHIKDLLQHRTKPRTASPLQYYLKIISFRNINGSMFINEELYHKKDVGGNCSACRIVRFTEPAVHLTHHRITTCRDPGAHMAPCRPFLHDPFMIRYAARSM